MPKHPFTPATLFGWVTPWEKKRRIAALEQHEAMERSRARYREVRLQTITDRLNAPPRQTSALFSHFPPLMTRDPMHPDAPSRYCASIDEGSGND